MPENTLSPDALRVLRDIYERGLVVLWAYRVPYPEYTDGEKMPWDDWQIADRELWRIDDETITMPATTREVIERMSVRDGQFLYERFLGQPDGSEKLLYRNSQDAQGVSDRIIKEEREVRVTGGDTMTFRSWKSTWLTCSNFEPDGWDTEYGIWERYTLTDKGKEVIGVSDA